MEVITERGIRVVKGNQLKGGEPAPDGIRRFPVFLPSSGQTGVQLDQPPLYMTVITTPPGNDSGWHNHGPYEIVAYVISGRSHFWWGKEGREEAIVEAGDFFQIAPGAIHREETLGESDFVLVSARCGPGMSLLVDGPEA